MKKTWIAVCVLAASHISINAYAEEKPDAISLTIYSKATPGSISPDTYRPIAGQDRGYGIGMSVPGYAVVRQERAITLEKERSVVSFPAVAAYIDPTTVSLTSLSYPKDTHVVEQNYLFDLVSRQALLEKYIDKSITVEYSSGDSIETVEGTLLSTFGGLIIRDSSNKIHTLERYDRIRFPELPGGLLTKPTLLWDIVTGHPGKHDVRLTYQTSGITWWADYNITYSDGKNANSGVLDLNSWVSIINQSGASYNEAKLKLMAGDVQRAAPAPAPMMYKAMREDAMVMAGAAAPGFQEKAFFEYHLYTLGRPATLPDNSTKQLELFPAAHGIQAKKELVFNANRGSKVAVYLSFKNSKENQLGVPLPSGRIRVNKLDEADKSLEFIGEDIIDHTAKDEDVRIKLGDAFDVVGERKQTKYNVDNDRKQIDEEIAITLRNRKDEAVTVTVEEALRPYATISITQSSHEYTKKNASMIEFSVPLKKGEEKTITYSANYRW